MQDIDRERQISRETERRWTDAYLETLALYRKICDGLINFDVLLFHGSVIDVDGKGYLFAARSGTGKSTHAALWRKVLPPQGHSVRMINDDKPLLRFTKEGILACGTPWNGKHQLDTNDMVPLSAIGQIVRSPENKVQKLAEEAFWPMALRQCYMPDKPESAERVLELLQRLHDEVPCCQIFCNMEPEAALVSWQGMSGAAKIKGKE